MTETEACIALNMVPNLGPVRLRHLLAVFKSPHAVLAARKAELRRVEGIGEEVAAGIDDWENRIDLPAELARVAEFGASVLTQASPEYPRALREIHNPPIVLYVWGAITARDQRAISVVGSRKSTHYGADCAKRLSYQLAYAGHTVVSGLARGIDSAAHLGALAAQGRTIGVIGSGLMDFYPPENRGLAEKIAASGAVVSEYPMTFPPNPKNFPYRNRIVSGWGQGLLVVEAGFTSGALIAAQHALEQGRLVYAVPGPIDRPTSAGCHKLIQQGAKLVTGAHDILDDLETLFPERTAEERKAARAESPLSETESAILEALEGETALDTIVARTKLATPTVSATLLALEMKRRVRQLPGQKFVRL